MHFAHYTRRLKTRMSKPKCTTQPRLFGAPSCLHDILVRDLDTLQRHAYFEIRGHVRLAVGHRLPSELVSLVFEYTMLAENVPLDPRVLVEALDPKHKHRTYLKSKSACTHPARVAVLAGEGGCIVPGWVVGEEWKERYPVFPHSEMRSMGDMEEFDGLYREVGNVERMKRTMERVADWER